VGEETPPPPARARRRGGGETPEVDALGDDAHLRRSGSEPDKLEGMHRTGGEDASERREQRRRGAALLRRIARTGSGDGRTRQPEDDRKREAGGRPRRDDAGPPRMSVDEVRAMGSPVAVQRVGEVVGDARPRRRGGCAVFPPRTGRRRPPCDLERLPHEARTETTAPRPDAGGARVHDGDVGPLLGERA
jgi:hypothetical protein